MNSFDVIGYFEALAFNELGPLFTLKQLKGVGLRLNCVSDLLLIRVDWGPKMVRDKAPNAYGVLNTGLNVLNVRQRRVLVEPR